MTGPHTRKTKAQRQPSVSAQAVDTYLLGVPVPERRELERLRAIIHNIVPDAEEVISYGMPGFKYHGKYLVGYNALKNHLALYPTSQPIDVLKAKLVKYSLSRGTIRYDLDNPLPERLIRELVQCRVRAIDQT